MPYSRFQKSGKSVKVFKKTSSGEKLAFVSHSSSVASAHRTAGIREAASKGSLRVKAKKKDSMGS